MPYMPYTPSYMHICCMPTGFKIYIRRSFPLRFSKSTSQNLRPKYFWRPLSTRKYLNLVINTWFCETKLSEKIFLWQETFLLGNLVIHVASLPSPLFQNILQKCFSFFPGFWSSQIYVSEISEKITDMFVSFLGFSLAKYMYQTYRNICQICFSFFWV